MLDWREVGEDLHFEREVSVKIPGAFLALREVRSLRLSAWWVGVLGHRRWQPLDGVTYRWSEIG